MVNSKRGKAKKIEEKIEEKKEVRSYLTSVLFQREPVEKDLPVADIFYRVSGNLIELQCYRPNFESDLDMIVAGDISLTNKVGSTVLISKSNSPVDWISNLHKSNEFSGNPFIAKEVQKIYEA